LERYFVCHAGAKDPDSDIGMMGRAYVWTGEWILSPQAADKRDVNPIMRLYPLWGDLFEVYGDVGCFTEVYFAQPQTSWPTHQAFEM
jgi:hypothetical protein